MNKADEQIVPQKFVCDFLALSRYVNAQEDPRILLLISLIWLRTRLESRDDHVPMTRLAKSKMALEFWRALDDEADLTSPRPAHARPFFKGPNPRLPDAFDPHRLQELARDLLAISSEKLASIILSPTTLRLIISDPTDPGLSRGTGSIPAMAVALANIQPGDVVHCPLDTDCSVAVEVYAAGGTAVIETPRDSLLATLLATLTDDAIKLDIADCSYEVRQNRGGSDFAAAIWAPAWGLRYAATPHLPSDRESMDIIRSAIQRTNGKVIVTAHPKFLFARGPSTKSFREKLLDKKQIEAIIQLPRNLYHGASFGNALLCLDTKAMHDSVRVLDVTDTTFVRRERERKPATLDTDKLVAAIRGIDGDTTLGALISTSDLLENHNCELGIRQLLHRRATQNRRKTEPDKKRRLDEFVSIIQPPPRRRAETGMIVHEVSSRDIKGYGFVAEPPEPVTIPDDSCKPNQFLRPFDLVFVNKGPVGKLGIVPPNVPAPGNGAWIAGQSCVVLRSHDMGNEIIDTRAIYMLLRGDVMQKEIRAMTSGSTASIVQTHKISSLELPWSSVRQPVLVRAFWKLVDIEKMIAELTTRQHEILSVASTAEQESPHHVLQEDHHAAAHKILP